MNPDPPSSSAIAIRKLSVTAGTQPLLRDADAEFSAGKITLIIGPSGAGKSVLLRLLAGLIDRHGGPIQWSGEVVASGEANDAQVGVVFQQFALFDEISAADNVQFAIDHRARSTEAPELSSTQWLAEMGIPGDVRVAALSGGQKQRLAVARTLAAEPAVVLYDEPTSGLDTVAGRKVADWIRRTQREHGKTCIVVTHDYEALAPIADSIIVFDAANQQLRTIEHSEATDFATLLRQASRPASEHEQPRPVPLVRRLRIIPAIESTGAAVWMALRLPWDMLPRWRKPIWGLRFLGHYLKLICGPSAILYLAAAGIIVGFVTTYFTFEYLPYALYTKPLLLEDLLTAIGFALYRIFVPVLATVLVAARCGAAVAADCGVKEYGGQIDSFKTFGVRPTAYLLSPIVIAFAVATPFLTWCAYQTARLTSGFAFWAGHPSLGIAYWELYFHAEIEQPGSWLARGFGWWLAKTVCCGVGTGAIAYYQGIRDKGSATDVSRGITATVLWATLWVLIVHFCAAFYEFD